MSVAPVAAPATHERPESIERVAPRPTLTAADRVAQETSELRRWYLFLGLPFMLAASFFMAAIGTGHLWFIGGTLVTGPGLLIGAFIYLGLSSDTNGAS